MMRTLKSPFVYFKSDIQPFHNDKQLTDFVDFIVRVKGIKSFCETGTFRGDTLSWFAKKYPDIFCLSIEYHPFYYWMNWMRLLQIPNIHMMRGDSGEILKAVIPDLKQPILFWLDAHWQKHLPLSDELKAISAWRPKGQILIDDISSKDYEGTEISLKLIQDEGFHPSLVTPTVAGVNLG